MWGVCPENKVVKHKMALEAVEAVGKAEDGAREVIAQAQAEAKTILAQAEKAGREALEAARVKAQAEVSEKLAQAEAAGKSKGDKALAKAREEAQALRQAALTRMDAAAARIVERVKGVGAG